MKKSIIGVLLVCLASISFSQSIEEVKLESVTITPLNTNYLNNVLDLNTPVEVIRLEKEAAKFDITTLDLYDPDFATYEVTFSQKDGKIVAVYDKDGNILRSSERFQNVILPRKVLNSVYAQNQGWRFHKDSYLVTYYEGRDAKKMYKIQLRKGNKRKNLRVDVDGNIM